MAVRQDDVRSWTPTSAPPEHSEAAAMLADLSSHRPAPPRPRTPSGASAAPTSNALPTPSAVPTPQAAPSTAPAGPDLNALPGENPTSPGFSPDGRWWWDGQRWTPTESLERTSVDGAGRRRRHWSPPLVWAGVVGALLAVLMLAALPVLWTGRGGGSDEALQTALLEVAEAQQQHLVDHGRFAPDDDALGLYLVRVGGLPDDVTVDVLASDVLTYCVAATATDGGRLWVSESGNVTDAACG